MNATSVVERVRVADGGRQIASQVGTHLVGGLAQKLGIPSALSAAMSTTVQRRSRHDRGRVLTQIAMTLAAGGRCISDVAVLRNQPSLFGQVASDATVWRVVDAIDDEVLDELRSARANVTASLLDRLDPGELILDVDASVFEVHSENKEGAAPHFKGGFGFHPLFVFAEPVEVALAGRLRPGNANANNATDQLQVIDDAIAALPDQWQAGHRDGDDPGEVVHQIVVRTDIAGYSHKVIGGLHGRNLAFSIGMPANEAFDGHIHRLRHDDWRPALDGDGRPRKGAQVAESRPSPTGCQKAPG